MRAVATMLTAFLAVPAGATAQTAIERGTIAVFPFYADSANADIADAIATGMETALDESGRFMAVLAMAADAAVKQALQDTRSELNLNSIVQIAQDAQLNANYVLTGQILGHDLKEAVDPTGSKAYRAEARVTVRIADVASRAMVLSENLTLQSGPTQEICSGNVLQRGKCEAENLVKRNWTYRTPEEALASIQTNGNAAVQVQGAMTEKLGYMLVDILEADGGMQVVLRGVPGDPTRGAKLKVVESVTGVTGSTYTRTIGKLQVAEIEDGIAFASITEGADAIVKAVTDGKTVLILKD
jgi:Peptidoglycan-synthase activator LpoB